MARPKKYHISLTEAERNRLKKLAKSAESKKLIRKRINILLDLDESQGKYLTYEQCVKANATSMMNVYKVIISYAKGGIDALLTIKRSSKSDTANIKVDGRAEAQLIQLACSEAPEGRDRWTLDLLVEKSKVILDTPVSRSTIGRILKKTNYSHTLTTTGASHRNKTRNS